MEAKQLELQLDFHQQHTSLNTQKIEKHKQVIKNDNKFSLTTHLWSKKYSTYKNNPVTEFYIPALKRAIMYDRKSGYFSSHVLARVADGLENLQNNQGKMRLIMSHNFSQSDCQQILKGYELRELLSNSLEKKLEPAKNCEEQKSLKTLGLMVRDSYLDIRVAIPLDDKNNPKRRLFHEKVGIFTDSGGNRLVFNGSTNESIGGWEENLESFHVFWNWKGGDPERVQIEVNDFELMWNNKMPKVKVVELPDAVRQKLISYTNEPPNPPEWKQKVYRRCENVQRQPTRVRH